MVANHFNWLRHPASVNPCGQVVAATSQREYASEQTGQQARAPQRASVIDECGRSGRFRAVQHVNPVAYGVAEHQPSFG